MVTEKIRGCALCEHDHDFEPDSYLIEQMAKGECVIFAGSGISTERKTAHLNTLYDELIHHFKLEPNSLPKLVTDIESSPDGRYRFIEKVLKRFEYIDSFSYLRGEATKFHAELATMPYIKNIITTNWDTYFEDYCMAKPFVYPEDMRFWGAANRAVLKLHGTIANLGSIVASEADYDDCLERLQRGAIGAKLKSLLAEKSCIFIGYSLRDRDFREIFEFIKGELGKFSRPHYYVSPYADNEKDHIAELGLEPIATDGANFLKIIKSHVSADYCYAEDRIYEIAVDLLDYVSKEHILISEKLKAAEYPQVIINLSYQDGLQDFLNRVLDLRASGKYSDLHTLKNISSTYESIKRDYIRNGNYKTAAYCLGYSDAAYYLENLYYDEDLGLPPIYFHLSNKYFDDSEQYISALDDLPQMHKAAYRYCKKIAPEDPELIVQHLPFF